MPDDRGWDVKRGKLRGDTLGRAPLEGARRECRRSADGMCSVEIAWELVGRSETGASDERGWDMMGCEAWK